MPPVKKKPPTSAKDTKQNKRVKQTKSKQSEDIIDEQPEIEVVEEEKKPCDTWLDHLPPVIKPDEELHKKLAAERKAKKEKIRMEMCREELGAIFNYAMTFMKVSKRLSERDLRKKKSAMKTDFLAGNFIQAEPEQQLETASAPEAKQSVSFISGPQSPPSIQKLLNTSEMTIQEAMRKLMGSVENPSFVYDANPELDQFLQTLARDMKPFTEPAPPPERVPCPFIISVVGPPCSGKSTICNFISKFFDVKFLNVLSASDDSGDPDALKPGAGDEKIVVNRLVKEISELAPKQGLLLRNFPANKSQLVSFDKALVQFSKQAKKDTSVHIVFRTVMTLEEATKQMSQRTIRKSTGTIYHPKFNPPNPVEVAAGDDIETVPGVENLAAVYDKALQGAAACEVLTKKGIPVISVPFLDTVDKLHMQIENALRQVYDQHNVPVPFTSFVNYVDVDQLVHAKLCYDIFNIWNDKCVPLYAADLSSLYMKMLAVENRMDYLELYTKEKLSLMLSRPDHRREMSQKFQQSPGDFGSFFKEIWEKSIEIRDNQNHMTAEILHSSGLSLLKGFLDECEVMIFVSLIKRFFLVDWFIKNFKNITAEHVNDTPVIKEFNPHDLEGLCSILGLGSYQKFSESKAPREEPAKKRCSRGAAQPVTVTVEERMRDFLEFLWSEMTIKVMRADSRLLLHINDYLTSRKCVIYAEIDSRIAKLQEQLSGWVDKKYAHEMESFAKRFRRLKQGEEVNEALFEFDKSFIENDSRIKGIVDRLGSKLPAIEEQLHLPIEKISHLFEKIGELNVDNVSLDNLLELAKESQFDEDELTSLEVMVRMTALPDYIDVKTFITSHMPNRCVVDEFQDALNSARREKPLRR